MITPLRLAATVAAGAAAVGCMAAAPHSVTDSAVTDTGAATSASARQASWSRAWGFGSGDSDGCPFVAAPGYLEGGGSDSQVIQDNGHAYMGCGDGPNISLDDVDGDTVTFSLHGDRVRVREGATERLGPYRVHVIDVRGERVELELSDPG